MKGTTKQTGVKVKAIGRAAAYALGLALAVQLSTTGAQAPAADDATQPAQTRPSDEAASIKAWFGDLASADSTIRSDALANLMSLKREDLPLLKEVVEASRPLAPAQLLVLRQIVTQVYLSGESYEGNLASGFLGVRMEQFAVTFHENGTTDSHSPGNGIIITLRMPGFPGARMLRDGDVILSILDRPDVPLRDIQDFAAIVKDMGAGATVHFQILRDGKVIQVGVKLDPRPIELDGFGTSDLLERRRMHADEYWSSHFALLVKEGVS